MKYSDLKRHLTRHNFAPDSITQIGDSEFVLTYVHQHRPERSNESPIVLPELEADYREYLPGIVSARATSPDQSQTTITITVDPATISTDDGRAVNDEFEQLFGIRLPDSLHTALSSVPAPIEEGAPVKLLVPYGAYPAGSQGLVSFSPGDGGDYFVLFRSGPDRITLTVRHDHLAELDWHDFTP
jgi:hypothetical protein